MSLLSYEDALSKMLDSAYALNVVRLATSEAPGRRVARAVRSLTDLPSFDNSQMDGFAVRWSEVKSASSLPVTLPISFTSAAGDTVQRSLEPGSAARIFTGAPIPKGADSVIPIEDVSADSYGNSIVVTERVEHNQFVRFAGEDVRFGDEILTPGQVLYAGRLALLSSAGHNSVSVYRQARIVILSNGDELVESPGDNGELKYGQVFESNALMLSMMAGQYGAEVVSISHASDSREALKIRVKSILEQYTPDLIVSSGGVSVGDRDFIRSVVAELGQITFWRAAIRPGKPILCAKIGPTHFLGLPGNPASALVTFALFGKPLLARLHGSKLAPLALQTTLSHSISHSPGRRSFVRAMSWLSCSGLQSTPLAGQGSHYVTSLASANSLIVIPEQVASIESGALCECILLGSLDDA